MRLIVMILSLVAVTACAQLPDLPEPKTPAGAEPDYPDLVSLNDLELVAAKEDEAARELETETAARVARLKARARALRRAQID